MKSTGFFSKVSLLTILGLTLTLPVEAALNPEVLSPSSQANRVEQPTPQSFLIAKKPKCHYVYYRYRGRLYRRTVCRR